MKGCIQGLKNAIPSLKDSIRELKNGIEALKNGTRTLKNGSQAAFLPFFSTNYLFSVTYFQTVTPAGVISRLPKIMLVSFGISSVTLDEE